MITTIVQFKLPSAITTEQAKQLFLQSAPKYRVIDGLIRKYYLISPAGDVAGGVYLWASRACAERFYDAAWTQFIRDKYGCEPQIAYYETPVVVDNPSGEIISED